MKNMKDLKHMTREERLKYFKENKSELLESELSQVNGGTADRDNPNSEGVDYFEHFCSSWGYICRGEEVCN